MLLETFYGIELVGTVVETTGFWGYILHFMRGNKISNSVKYPNEVQKRLSFISYRTG